MEAKIKNAIDSLIGIPYKHNGRSLEGVDCWGLVYLFFKHLGFNLPIDDGNLVPENWYKIEPERYINGLKTLGDEVEYFKYLQPLDIPYFRLYRDVITHSVVMVDDEHFIHVLIDKVVRIDTMRRRFWRRKCVGAIRVNLQKFLK